MEVTSFAVQGPKFFQMKKLGDDRGFFCERFRADEMSRHLPQTHFCQENFSRSQPGTLRGLHYQFDPPQGKLVTVTSGKILDVIVDLREGSLTFGEHVAVTLDANEPAWFWVPVGFAHGFCVLGDAHADLLYKVTDYYNAIGEGGLSWNDPALKIAWPYEPKTVSARDKSQPLLKDLKPLAVSN